jgi:hypothetical protein
MNDQHGANMNKSKFLLVFLVFGLFSSSIWADGTNSSVPEPFRGFDPNSKLKIDYTDLDSLLDTVVLDTGRSDRSKAKRPQTATGTRMTVKVNRSTINEGNRFYFEVFGNNPENQKTLARIRSRLESLPSNIALERFSRDEQLAYWINLYNITMIEAIAQVYPIAELEDLIQGEDSVLQKKSLTVAGIALSLNDIEFTILRQNYDANPLVIYGLYQGIIGGPNIRKRAYTGKNVYADLIDNALEFVNSNRGTESKSKKVFEVSSFYARNASFFPDFDADLRAHLLEYLEGEQLADLQSAAEIDADIDDWTTTSLFGSQRSVGGSFATSNAALGSAMGGASGSNLAGKAATGSQYSPAVLKHLDTLNKKRAEEQTGTVTVEEIGQAEQGTDN